MERRDFLKLGGAAGVGAAIAGNSACLPGLIPRRMSQREIDQILAKMDSGLDHVSRYDMLDDFAKRTGKQAKLDDSDRALVRTSVRALYTSSVFHGLPEEARMHPAMQERMYGHLAEMDEAVFGMTDRMASAPHDQRERVRRTLKADSSLPEALSQGLDRGMSRLDMALGRRIQMRRIFSQVGWRMQNQSPSIVIDEYAKKVAKASEQVGSQAELERRIAAQIGQESYWRYQNHLALMFADDPPSGGAPPTPAPQAPQAPGPDEPIGALLVRNAREAAARGYCETVAVLGRQLSEVDPERYQKEFLTDPAITGCKQHAVAPPLALTPNMPCEDAHSLANAMARKKVIGTGGWMLGIGVITGVIGLAVVGAGSDAAVLGAIMLTVGGALLIGGLIVVIVGAGMAEH